MISPRNVRNIIFDFGGVLFEIDYHKPVEAFAALGFTGFENIYAQASQDAIFDRLETGQISNESFLKHLHSLAPAATMKDVCEAWNSILVGLWPERVEFVRKIRQKGYRTFLLSNTNAIHVAVFEEMIDDTIGIENFYTAFEKVHYSNQLGLKKPYPETYRHVCKMHGLKPGETLFIDDSAQHVKGAAEAGLQTYHLQSGESLMELMCQF